MCLTATGSAFVGAAMRYGSELSVPNRATGRGEGRDESTRERRTMARAPLIEIRESGRPPRHVVPNRPLVIGRECDGENIADTEVSREHLRLVGRWRSRR